LEREREREGEREREREGERRYLSSEGKGSMKKKFNEITRYGTENKEKRKDCRPLEDRGQRHKEEEASRKKEGKKTKKKQGRKRSGATGCRGDNQ
jgi:hypothetical protein